MDRNDNAERESIDENNIHQEYLNAEQALKLYYLNIRPSVYPVLIENLPDSALRDISILFGIKSFFPTHDWRSVACYMGVDSHMKLATIEHAAAASKDTPLYVTFIRFLNDRSIVLIIDAALRMDRCDILKYLEPYVRGFLLNLHNGD